MRNPAEKPIEEYAFFRELIALPFIEAIYLCGSRARGTHDERSDVDLAILCPQATDEEWNQVNNIVRNNEEMLVRADPIRFDKLQYGHYFNNFFHTRKLLYLKSYGGNAVALQAQLQFFDLWSTKLEDWLKYMESLLAEPRETVQEKKISDIANSFCSSYSCIWVIVRKALSIYGMRVNTPLATFREAYMEGWLSDRPLWEQMMEDYRDTPQAKEEDFMQRIYPQLPKYSAAMREACQKTVDVIKPYTYANASQN